MGAGEEASFPPSVSAMSSASEAFLSPSLSASVSFLTPLLSLVLSPPANEREPNKKYVPS